MPKPSFAVNRDFLNDLAKTIYDSKNRRFLRLCSGTLQNGPDPTNKKRVMHCGLGELYFAMTGHQPEQDGVDEERVINLAVERSAFAGQQEKQQFQAEQALATAKAVIKSLKLNTGALAELDSSVQDDLIATIEEAQSSIKCSFDDGNPSDEEQAFRDALDAIPGVNDGCGASDRHGSVCTTDDYRERSKHVAAQLRAAAKCLPL